MAEILELAELAQHDGRAEVDVRRGGVDARASRAVAGPIASLSLELVLGAMQSTVPARRRRRDSATSGPAMRSNATSRPPADRG